VRIKAHLGHIVDKTGGENSMKMAHRLFRSFSGKGSRKAKCQLKKDVRLTE
jgi:hypothetical protein